MHRVRHARCTRRSGYPDRGYTSVTAGKRSRQASVTRGYRTSTTNYPEAGSTSTHMCIISESVQPVCNPGRGRYIYIYHAGGGTRFARLPPVIEIIPRSGYHSHLSLYADMHRVRHTACTRRRSYPDRGYTSVTAGKRSRQASVTRGWMTPPSHYPEAGSTSTHMCIISQTGCTRRSGYPGRGIAHAQKGKRPPNRSPMTFPSYKAR